MKKILLSTLLFNLLAINNANAGNFDPTSFYLQGNIGYGFDVKHKFVSSEGVVSRYKGKGSLGSVAIGYKGNHDFRFEVEYYVDNGFKSKVQIEEFNYAYKWQLRSSGVFANAYYDFQNISSFTPFAGFGVGYMTSKVIDYYAAPGDNWQCDSFRKSHFSWKGTIGGSYAFSKEISLILQYQYLDKRFKKEGSKNHSKIHAPIFGMRYSF